MLVLASKLFYKLDFCQLVRPLLLYNIGEIIVVKFVDRIFVVVDYEGLCDLKMSFGKKSIGIVGYL